MRKHIQFLLPTLLIYTLNVPAQTVAPEADAMQQIVQGHYNHYKTAEYFSCVGVAVSIPEQKIKSYYAGTVSHEPNSPKISADTLFEIGSITKSFTAAIILQLEREGKLTINSTLDSWLPKYSKWSTVSIKSLLNMTSGLPNYTDTPIWLSQAFQNIKREWTNEEILGYVYPPQNFSPPLRQGYFYSNTGYVVLDLIIQKASHDTYRNRLQNLFKTAGLNNTFYPVPTMDPNLLARLSSGYSYNQYDNPLSVGQDMRMNNLSWGGAAGAIIATPEDIIKWVQALFIDNKVLDQQQKQKLMQIVSTDSGDPIANVTSDDPSAFGLGVAKLYGKDIGPFWFYEGETFGYRAIYMYVPCNKVIIAATVNSATNSSNDHLPELLNQLYQQIINQNPKLNCGKDSALQDRSSSH